MGVDLLRRRIAPPQKKKKMANKKLETWDNMTLHIINIAVSIILFGDAYSGKIKTTGKTHAHYQQSQNVTNKWQVLQYFLNLVAKTLGIAL